MKEKKGVFSKLVEWVLNHPVKFLLVLAGIMAGLAAIGLLAAFFLNTTEYRLRNWVLWLILILFMLFVFSLGLSFPLHLWTSKTKGKKIAGGVLGFIFMMIGAFLTFWGVLITTYSANEQRVETLEGIKYVVFDDTFYAGADGYDSYYFYKNVFICGPKAFDIEREELPQTTSEEEVQSRLEVASESTEE